MTFSIQNNPYFSMYPPMQYSDPAVIRKVLALRQNINARLQSSHGMELLNSLLASYACGKFPPQDISSPPKFQFPPLGPLFSSPGLFQQALASAFQPGALPFPRQFAEDLSLPALPRSSEAAPPPPPKVPKRMPPSPAGLKRKQQFQDFPLQSDRERIDSILYCQPTFYPILKDQVEKTHQSLRAADGPKFAISSHIQETGVLVPSLIDGEIIMGFNVWGEKRLCLPHLFRFVLNDVDLKAIDEACTKLQITCTTCTPAQLTLLHSRKILPKAVSSCGLIRKSDAERLTKFIRNRTETSSESPRTSSVLHSQSEVDVESNDLAVSKPKSSSDALRASPIGSDVETEEVLRDEKVESAKSNQSHCSAEERDCSSFEKTSASAAIPVIHECFGRQRGLIHPQLYTEPSSKCIECRTCRRLFAPEQFVGHTHTVTEVDNLNHWGFDSNNWRCYLRLYTGRRSRPDSPERSSTQEVSEDETIRPDPIGNVEGHRRLEEFKIKFAQPIRLPASLSAALRTVGLCASIAPIPPPLMTPDAQLVTAPFPPQPFVAAKSVSCKEPCAPVSNTSSQSSVTTSGPMSSMMLPQLTLRRLWAPNDGRIRVPPPPKPLVNRDGDTLPKRLQTGPPLLLHSHRVVTQAAAERYDRDFIPNVCLMPPLKPKPTGLVGRYRVSSQNQYDKRHSFHRSRQASSGSRSCTSSAHSSGSSSSRTRSVSVSSTSSSSCSYDRPGKRHCNGLSSHSGTDKPDGQSLSMAETTESMVDDKGKSTQRLSHKRKTKAKSRSNSWATRTRMRSLSQTSDSARSDSVISLYNQQLSAVKRRRCRSLTVPFNHYLEARALVGPRNSLQSSSVRHVADSTTTRNRKLHNDSTSAHVAHSYRSRKLNYPSQQYRCESQWQDRALAAAKAAQGVASRTCPGLWSRHFTNLNGSSSGPLDLPNAREPLPGGDTKSDQSRAHMSNTPVLVTSPTKNSLPTAILALESIWADLVRHIDEYTVAVESRSGVSEARQRLFEQFITMQTCYATHIATLASENQKLLEKLASVKKQRTPSNSPKIANDAQSSHSNFSLDWNKNASNSAKQHLPPNQSTTQITNQTSARTVFPHRSRKESAKMFSDQRFGPAVSGFGDSENRYISVTNEKSIDPAPIIKEHPRGLQTAVPDLSQNRFVVSPIYTNSSSEDTNQASTTPTASETEGLPPENSINGKYIQDIPHAANLHASDRSLRFSTPSCSNAGQSFRCSVDGDASTKQETGSLDADSLSFDGDISHGSTTDRRRSLLPPTGERPRMTLKPHSRLLTRS